MLVIGLTGSIGMGKSAVAAHLRQRGIAVFDADAEVHKLYQGPAAQTIGLAFPGTVMSGVVDRSRLAQALGSDPSSFKRLEAIVHPLVWVAERDFLRAAKLRGDKISVLEIPLLFEGGNEKKMDAVIVVSAPIEVQRRRVLERDGMTETRLEDLLARQMPDSEKLRRADFVVDTGGTIAKTHTQTDIIIAKLSGWPALAFDRDWKT
ncbi:MAG: dephospho-CoA kinase [Hyphomicrobium sp.]